MYHQNKLLKRTEKIVPLQELTSQNSKESINELQIELKNRFDTMDEINENNPTLQELNNNIILPLKETAEKYK